MSDLGITLLLVGAIAAVAAGLVAAEMVPHGVQVHEIMETHERLGLTVAGIATVLGTVGFDGLVSGAVHTTAHTVRPALQLIKTSPGCNLTCPGLVSLFLETYAGQDWLAINVPWSAQMGRLTPNSRT